MSKKLRGFTLHLVAWILIHDAGNREKSKGNRGSGSRQFGPIGRLAENAITCCGFLLPNSLWQQHEVCAKKNRFTQSISDRAKAVFVSKNVNRLNDHGRRVDCYSQNSK
jgi:hypothetical protein